MKLIRRQRKQTSDDKISLSHTDYRPVLTSNNKGCSTNYHETNTRPFSSDMAKLSKTSNISHSDTSFYRQTEAARRLDTQNRKKRVKSAANVLRCQNERRSTIFIFFLRDANKFNTSLPAIRQPCPVLWCAPCSSPPETRRRTVARTSRCLSRREGSGRAWTSAAATCRCRPSACACFRWCCSRGATCWPDAAAALRWGAPHAAWFLITIAATDC